MIKEQTNNNVGDVTEDKIYEKQTTTGRIVDSVPLLRFKTFFVNFKIWNINEPDCSLHQSDSVYESYMKVEN